MKFVPAIPAISLFCISFSQPCSAALLPVTGTDSLPVTHATDGRVDEWADTAFHPDSDSTLFFAADNDDKNLYVALRIPAFAMQSKYMRNGMKLFIDPKEKKKEGHGVEFPIAGEVNNFLKETMPEANESLQTDAPSEDRPKRPEPDHKQMRNMMSLGLTALKVFGLGSSSSEQGLTVPGSVNIAYKWDVDGEMHVEYCIPLSLLRIDASDQSTLGIGWKVNGIERFQPAGQEGGGGRGGRRGGGGRGGFSGSGGNSRGFNNSPGRTERRMSMADMMKEQSFWTSYRMRPAAKKAF